MEDYTFFIRLTHGDVAEAIGAFIHSKYPDYKLAPAENWETDDNGGEHHTVQVLLPVTQTRRQP